MNGYLRHDGRKGIRNITVVAYLVECAHHVAREVVFPFRERGVHLLGFPGCFPNAYGHRMLHQLCTHPNVGAVLLVSLGCEGFNRRQLLDDIRATGRPAGVLVIQEAGGTRRTIAEGREWIAGALEQIAATPRVEFGVRDLVVGTVCGGSDATSGITANPAVGRAFDRLVENGARVIFEESGELIGCEQIMAARAARPALMPELVACVDKAARYYATLGHGSFAPGNAEGGLTTLEEKSMGAYCKSGQSPINGILKPGDVPPAPGLYLLDVVPDGEVRWGFPNINDIQEIGELIACGSHVTLFTTGRGSVVGSAISPVIKICANPETYRRLSEDMDVNAGRILEGQATLEEVGREIYDEVMRVASGGRPRAKASAIASSPSSTRASNPSARPASPLNHMLPMIRPSVRLLILLAATMLGTSCSPFHYSEASARPEKKTETGSGKKGWSLLPWGGRSTGGEATTYIEYQRTQSQGSEPLYTLVARNTHPNKTIEGQMRTTLQTSPSDMKMDSQNFTLAPNEQRRLLVYPTRFPLTYEVTASFQE